MKKEIEFEVIRDTREQDGWTFSRSKAVTNIIDDKLDTGDYAVVGLVDKLCIERKATTAEIANNISERRFYAELERMQAYPHRFLVCEFAFKDVLDFPRNSGIPFNKQKFLRITAPFMLKTMTDIQVKYNVNVIYAGNKGYAEVAVDNVMRRIYELYGEK